jgi:hypothetical protein
MRLWVAFSGQAPGYATGKERDAVGSDGARSALEQSYDREDSLGMN